jgi:16S rRNA (cytosine967-C5)-methyltransferase
VRAVALDVISEVLDNGQYTHIVLRSALDKYLYLEKQERAFLTRLVQGTIENKIYLEYVTEQFSSTPVSKMKPLIRNILLMSVYQIIFMEQVPDSAAVNEAVKLAKKRKFAGLSGFVNGVLRSVSRNKHQIKQPQQSTLHRLSICYSQPEWLVKRWLKDYDEETVETVLQAFLKEKKTYIRCRSNQVQNVWESLEKSGITVEMAPYIDYALCVSGYNYLAAIPQFKQGLFFVQDVSSMLVGLVAAPKQGDFVLDICAAPGGKATHAAQLMDGTGHVEARDLSEPKVELIRDNIRRLQLTNMEARVWDAAIHDPQMEGKADILICDLPCSGLGIIGRKPDIKYRITEEQLHELAKLQRCILEKAWTYVKPGGRLVYSTCTIDRSENEENVKWILENLPFDAEDIASRLPVELRQEQKVKGCIQLLPGIHKTDGFFISSFIRR